MVSLVLLQWDVLGSDYYLIQLLFYNYGLLLNKDQEIKVFQYGPDHPTHTPNLNYAKHLGILSSSLHSMSAPTLIHLVGKFFS